MNWTTNMDNKIREIELRHNPVMIRVNKFTEESANEFAQKMAKAHNTGQSVIPIVIDSYGGQVYSLKSILDRHMNHDVSSGAFGKNEEIQASARETKRLNNKIYEILADNCKKPRDYFTKEVRRRGQADWFVTPNKAKKMGLADVIGMPKLLVNIKVDIDLAVPEQ